MTFEEVQELFVRAAYIDRKMMRESVLPAAGSPWPRYHHEAGDIAGWSKEDRKAYEKKLARNGGDYGDARRSREAITTWEQASELIKLVTHEGHRRCLLAWAMAMAGGRPFVRFCEGENLQEDRARRWKNKAIARIVAESKSEAPYDSGEAVLAVLPSPPEKGHKTPTLAIDATTRGGAWRDQETEAARDTILSDWKVGRTWWRRKAQAAR
jgi:hypothetical protein